MCAHKGPGKFNSCSDEYLYNLDPDDQVNINDIWYAKIDPPYLEFSVPYVTYFPYDVDSRTDEANKCIMEDKLNNYRGVIIEETGNGFVNIKYYDTKTDYETDWDNILAEAELQQENEEIENED